ncbi:GIY-YIG nuclease family protein [Salinibacter ruber]|jgi:hypothetical protein|uniref:GIY-YIG nuclease family protein n=1 Tax=Salinibacter ruber TaxID=146919 RepID=UPI002169DAAA|nr:GIY-YIG nuclease family protein [Salinibacter ruber]MCS4051308.1 hypothetical protein [Salinibacter ruber]
MEEPFLIRNFGYVAIIVVNILLAEKYNRSKVWVGLLSIAAHLLVTLYLVVVITASAKQGQSQGREEDATRGSGGSSAKGSVYVLTNPALSDVVKIGYTTRSAEVRARELSGTGVPGKWQVAHEISTGSPKQVEKTVHQKLSRQKVQDGGEFFQVSPEKAVRVIRSVA